MSEQTKIEWATHTFNPWIGCTKVQVRQRTGAATWRKPVKWNKDASRFAEAALGYGTSVGMHDAVRQRVFPSLCDWLDDEVPIEWLADFLKLIHDTPNLDWLLLTKRPENFKDRLTDVCRHCEDNDSRENGLLWAFVLDWVTGDEIPANVWVGTSVEDQARADERIPELLKIPAAVRFLSVEPLLAPVDLGYRGIAPKELTHGSYLPVSYLIDWVIIGGESGPGARPCNVEWIRDIVRQCKEAGVPCFVKQLGSVPVQGKNNSVLYDGGPVHPKGGDPTEWPEDLRVREFPNQTARL